ncbi:MAG: SpoIIE family protein phosphatase [Lachnospiraceae bacterium]|nr:SpoIIE family protein phosphatase [Lachnospiraceae bacterium]
MRKQAEVRDDNRITIIPEYGRQRLLNYAESFRDLADLFEEEEEDAECADTQKTVDRRDYLWQRKLQENQGLLAEHLKEMAHIMAEVAKETCLYHPMSERRYRQMSKLLRDSGIQLRNFFELEHEDGHVEISLTMKTASEKYIRLGEKEHISVEDVADFISVVMNTRLRAAKSAPLYLTPEWNTYYFIEEPVYHLLTGVAKAVKETEHVSGDNYSFYEAEDSRMVAVLSDGMGSGEKACRDSGRVIELMERFLEAGFRKEAAIQMINGALTAAGQEENMSTLDLCDMNLYTGECEFIKVGAACTYIKRGRLVDRLSTQSFPLGVFGQLEPEVMYRTLLNGDYVIMLSDGVTDALSQGIGEEVLPEIIGKMEFSNPNEIANQILAYCLKQSNGQIRDDMTVLVIGVWDQAGDCNLV